MTPDQKQLASHPAWPIQWPAEAIVTELFVDSSSPSGLRWREFGRGRRQDLVAGCLNNVSGYWRVSVGGTSRSYPCHQLVMYLSGCFPADPKLVVDHIDRDRSNNKFENLRWVTQKENCKNVERKYGVLHPSYPFQAWVPGRKKYVGLYRKPYANEIIKVGYYSDAREASIMAVAHRLENFWVI